MVDFARIDGFDWDDGNRQNSSKKHAITQAEAEQIFANSPLLIVEDLKHSGLEQRSGTLFAVVTGRLGKPDHLIPKSECFVVIQSRRQPGGALQRVVAKRIELQCGAIGIGRFQKILLLHKSLGFCSKRVGALCFQPMIGRPQCEQGCQQ